MSTAWAAEAVAHLGAALEPTPLREFAVPGGARVWFKDESAHPAGEPTRDLDPDA